MPIYNIRGIDVDFPFKAYDCQIVYMEKVIQSLQNKCNALLESPTGTGKTLCLLCASLAWRRSLGEFTKQHTVVSTQGKSQDPGSPHAREPTSSQKPVGTGFPAIVYTTRTHSQLKQVIRELKKTNYRPRMIVLGSREQLCIQDDVQLLQGRAQINACQFYCKKRKCSHHAHVTEYLNNNPFIGNEPVDIEDLVNIGKSQGPCPYYLSKELHKSVDILFAPYNYLIEQWNRTSLTIEWRGSALIFDEAHNLESICADAASFDLPSSLLTACVSEAQKCIQLSATRRSTEKSSENSLNPERYAILKALLLKLEKRINEVPIESKDVGFTRPGPYIYELLTDLNITKETSSMLIDTISDAIKLIEDDENKTSSGSNRPKGVVCRLENIGDMLRIIFKDNGDTSHAKSYRVHVQEAEAKGFDANKGKATTRTLSWWCFNPGIALEGFSRKGVGSVILTSGTLSPLDSFAQELKLEFPIRLENPHVISSNQIWAGVVSTGPSSCSFNSSYRNRDSLAYKQELGNAIANFARIVPDGLLVFFPSYYLLDQCIGCWKDMSHTSSTSTITIWERICRHKQPVVEPRQSSLFSSSIEDFTTKLTDKTTSGAIFFAVCRGKVSEGLDFADHAGRAVIITGIPFATWTDPKVRLKREYLEKEASQTKEYKALTGSEWYSQQASRAVNQAVGRVIRHRDDYGAIIFCDQRFADPGRQSQMSLWIRPHVKCYSKFGEVVSTLTRFYRDIALSDLPKPTLKDSVSIDDGKKNTLNGDKLLFAKTLTNLTNVTDENCSKKSLSSLCRVNRSNTSSQLHEILPANRSTLISMMENPWNRKGKDSQYKKDEVIDLTSNSEWHGQSRRDPIVSCSSKKPKIDPETMLHTEKKVPLEQLDGITKEHLSSYSSYHVSKKHGKPSQQSLSKPLKPCTHENNRNRQDSQIGAGIVLENAVTAQETAIEVPAQKTKGSAFLMQVKEMLSPGEYLEFLGYVKALKSKEIKASEVLQSIARLFSIPERLFLRKSFRDYLHVKYHPMYEQHLKTDDAADGS